MSTNHPFITLVREGGYNLPQWNPTLPFSEIVEYVSHNIEWSPKDSIYKLILMFCLPEMQKRWETLRSHLLVYHPVQHIFHYAKEGKPIQLAALLLIDPPHFHIGLGLDAKLIDKLPTIEISRELVATEMASLIVEEQKLSGRRSNKLAQKKRLMTSAMMLLEIFERVGVEIEYFVSGSHIIHTQSSNRAEAMAKYLVFTLKDSGFPVTNELEVFKHMNCNCLLDERQWDFSGGFTFLKNPCEDPYHQLYTKFESISTVENRRDRMRLWQQQRRSLSTHSLREKPVLCYLVHSFYMSQRFKTRFSPKFCTNTEAQTRITFPVIRRHVPGLVLSKKISSFLLAIKRGIDMLK